MEKITVDNGQKFDFGRTSAEYAKYRDIYPPELYDRLYSLGVGAANTRWLDLGTGTGTVVRGLAKYGADIVAIDSSKEQIAQAIELSREYDNIRYEVVRAEDIFCPDHSFDTVAAESASYLEHSFDVVTACQCFWYFDPAAVVPMIKRILKSGGMFLKLYMSYLKDDPIASRSHALVKELNPNWTGGSAAVLDLRTHYFDDPQLDSFYIDLPFTRESWHGRIKACRGVLASMDGDTFRHFEKRHLEMLSTLPECFTVRHKVFLTYYIMK